MKQVSDIDIWAEQHLNGNTPQLSELRCGQKKKKGVTKIELQHVLINKQLSRPSGESEMNIHCFSLPL